ncbi:MAG: 30S ribosomal protein S5 [Patescibacteria group bacterium]|jgi:small subunit ribosomal protein S5
MDQDIKQIKDQERDVELENEAKEVKAGKLEVEEIITPDAVATAEEPKAEATAAVVGKPGFRGRGGKERGAGLGGRGGHGRGEGGGGRRRGDNKGGEDGEFEQKIIDLARVTRVMAGGKRMRFRACVAIGDRKGRVAVGLAKGQDVTVAIAKAVTQAKKDIITVPIVNGTIPIEVREKYKAARVLFKPAKQGKGVIAGGAVRIVLELAGVPNIVTKILGSNNKVTNVKVTMKALNRIASYWRFRGGKTDADKAKKQEKEIKK